MIKQEKIMKQILEYSIQDIVRISDRNIEKGHEIIKELEIEGILEKHSGKANLVGSVKTNLLMSNLDIDFHVYTDNFTVKESFLIISKIAESPKIKEIQYVNMLEHEDKCLEWHLKYIDDEERTWQIDIIHILEDSKYAGKFERVSDKIKKVMNEKIREQILSIKYEADLKEKKVAGIEVYRAVLEGGVKDYEEFEIWYENNRLDGIIEWEPDIE